MPVDHTPLLHTSSRIRSLPSILQILLQILHRRILPRLIPFNILDQLFRSRNLLLGVLDLGLDRQQVRLLFLECTFGLFDFGLLFFEFEIGFCVGLFGCVDFAFL